jgi:uncharacterized protein (DUF736 family)
MADYDNTDTGALFKNDKKTTDKHPDYRGQINVAGTEFWLSAWINTSKAGAKFMSLSVTPKDEKPAERKPAPADFDDDIPF